MALVEGVGGWGRSMHSAFPGNCSVSYLSFVYGRSLWAELNGGEYSFHWKANTILPFSIMTLTLWSVRNALPMMPLSQVKVSYIPRFYRSPLKHFLSYYYTIFKLIFFNMTPLCQITVVKEDLFLNSRHLWRHEYTSNIKILKKLWFQYFLSNACYKRIKIHNWLCSCDTNWSLDRHFVAIGVLSRDTQLYSMV